MLDSNLKDRLAGIWKILSEHSSVRVILISIGCFLVIVSIPAARVCADTGKSQTISQQKINEMAAALLKVRRDVFVQSLRTPGETAEDFCRKISYPLSGESKYRFLARLSGYDISFQALTNKSTFIKTVPVLQNTTSMNITIWNRIGQQLSYLPARIRKVQTSLRTAEKNPDKKSFSEVSRQVLQTMRMDVSLYDLLRDALP